MQRPKVKPGIKKYYKIIILLNFLAVWFSALTVVSFVQAPEKYQASGEQLATYSDFASWSRDTAVVTESSLAFCGNDSSAKVFAVMLPLQDIESVWVEFSVNCPEQYQGAVLHVDLYAEGYDSPEQEFVTVLTTGENKIAGILHKGDNAPEKAWFRIFSLDPGEYAVEELVLRKAVKSQRIQIGLTVTIALMTTLLLSAWDFRKSLFRSKKDDSKRNTKEAAFVLAVCSILYIPFVLGVISDTSSLACDVPLLGYTDSAQKPEFTWASFMDRSFQNSYIDWFDQNLKPRGAITKTYATLRYNLFNEGTRPIGHNKDIFEFAYINAKYSLTPEYNMANPDMQNAMDTYVDTLAHVQEKLRAAGKHMYVYIAASKADFYSENIPQKYKDLMPENAVNIVDYMRNALNETTIPHLFCSDLAETLIYPAYYSTGIHWSRTFEETVSAAIISDLKIQTGKKYRDLVIGDVKESRTPFWRDADVFNLLNVWNKNKSTRYYEFELLRQEIDDYDNMRFLIWGDSYAEGLWHDLVGTYPEESDIYYIRRDQGLIDSNRKYTKINQDWSSLDLQFYLDHSDVIIMGCTVPDITLYSCGFIQYLNLFLDEYVPAA